MKLPKVRNRIEAGFIDATPEGYALRILEYYRERCNESWEVHGLSEDEARIYEMMNKHQEERAKVLDETIKILRENNGQEK